MPLYIINKKNVVKMLIDIFDKIHEADKNVFLLMIGAGELREKIERKLIAVPCPSRFENLFSGISQKHQILQIKTKSQHSRKEVLRHQFQETL